MGMGWGRRRGLCLFLSVIEIAGEGWEGTIERGRMRGHVSVEDRTGKEKW